MLLMTSYPNHTEVLFTVHPQVTSKSSRPCIIYQQIDFNIPIKISFITFRNFYCAAIIIKFHISSHNENDWNDLLEQQLMINPNFEDDAQNYHSIELNTSYITSLRFYLQQPSPNWRSFGLNDVKCYSLTESQAFTALNSNATVSKYSSVLTSMVHSKHPKDALMDSLISSFNS